MNTCPRCDVELAPDAPFCPLCGQIIDPARAVGLESYAEPGAEEKLTEGERRKVSAELLTASILIPAVAVCAINILVSGGITWGLYPLLSLALLWVVMGAILGIFGQKHLAFGAPALAIPLFLIGLDLADGGLGWSVGLGLPIAILAEGIAGLVILALRASRRKGANIPAFIVLGVALLCLSIEAIIDRSLGGGVHLEWSAIVAFALVPISALLFYLHIRLTHKSSLRKLFRL
jgi:hypothetical protein